MMAHRSRAVDWDSAYRTNPTAQPSRDAARDEAAGNGRGFFLQPFVLQQPLVGLQDGEHRLSQRPALWPKMPLNVEKQTPVFQRRTEEKIPENVNITDDESASVTVGFNPLSFCKQ